MEFRSNRTTCIPHNVIFSTPHMTPIHPFFQENNHPSFLSQNYFPLKNENSATLIINVFEELKSRSKQVREEWIANTFSSKVSEK